MIEQECAARPSKYFTRRKLPHFQGEGQPVFVTFVTAGRWVLPEQVRSAVLKHCLHDRGRKMELHCAVVMPDHVHVLYRPMEDSRGRQFGLSEIVGSLKSASAHTVNRVLNRQGRVWQDESYDHILRVDESLTAVIDYISNNPVRKGICDSWGQYPYLWRAWE